MVKSVLMDITNKRPDQGYGLSQHGEVHAGPDSCLITMSKQPRVDSFTLGPRVDSFTLGPRVYSFTLGPRVDSFTRGPRVYSFTRGPRVYFLLLRDHVYILTQGPLGLFSLSA